MAVTVPEARARIAAYDSETGDPSFTDADVLMALDMAEDIIEAHAPDAPVAAKDEAILRLVGWHADFIPSRVRSETVGPKSVEYGLTRVSALFDSGAADLLATWRVHRGGVC